MVKHLAILFLLTVYLFPNASQASCFFGLDYQLMPGFYTGVVGGINGGYPLTCKRAKTNRGYYLGLKVGKKFFYNIRLEEEFTWQENQVNTLNKGTTTTVQFTDIKGNVNIWSLMTNGIFDFCFNCNLPGRPYLGAGIGYAYAEGRWSGNFTRNNDPLFIEKHIRSSIHKGGFAWQIIAGLNFFICPRLSISLEYRFFDLETSCIRNHKLGLTLTKFF